MSEFKLKRTAREWVLEGSTIHIEAMIDGIGVNTEDPQDFTMLNRRVILTDREMEALVRLWERELRPARAVSEGDPIAALCLKPHGVNLPCKHICTNFENHIRKHGCQCGFEWE